MPLSLRSSDFATAGTVVTNTPVVITAPIFRIKERRPVFFSLFKTD
jgi:hypothetical protein